MSTVAGLRRQQHFARVEDREGRRYQLFHEVQVVVKVEVVVRTRLGLLSVDLTFGWYGSSPAGRAAESGRGVFVEVRSQVRMFEDLVERLLEALVLRVRTDVSKGVEGVGSTRVARQDAGRRYCGDVASLAVEWKWRLKLSSTNRSVFVEVVTAEETKGKRRLSGLSARRQ